MIIKNDSANMRKLSPSWKMMENQNTRKTMIEKWCNNDEL